MSEALDPPAASRVTDLIAGWSWGRWFVLAVVTGLGLLVNVFVSTFVAWGLYPGCHEVATQTNRNDVRLVYLFGAIAPYLVALLVSPRGRIFVAATVVAVPSIVNLAATVLFAQRTFASFACW